MTADVRSHQPITSHRRTRAIAVGAAALAAVLVRVVAQVAGVDLKVDLHDGNGLTDVPTSLPFVLGLSLIVALLGWGLLALLERFAPRRATVIWTVTAVVVFLVSLAGPLSLEAGAGTKTLLALMHAAVGAVLIPALARSASSAS
jgi:hypothetical protein